MSFPALGLNDKYELPVTLQKGYSRVALYARYEDGGLYLIGALHPDLLESPHNLVIIVEEKKENRYDPDNN